MEGLDSFNYRSIRNQTKLTVFHETTLRVSELEFLPLIFCSRIRLNRIEPNFIIINYNDEYWIHTYNLYIYISYYRTLYFISYFIFHINFCHFPSQCYFTVEIYCNSVFVFFRLNYLMSGLTTSWYHATNIALHAIACVLVTKVSLAVASLRPGFAALTGLLFAAHPVHTEAVSNCQACNSRDEIIRKCTFYFKVP